jgi:hypothetical protein
MFASLKGQRPNNQKVDSSKRPGAVNQIAGLARFVRISYWGSESSWRWDPEQCPLQVQSSIPDRYLPQLEFRGAEIYAYSSKHA